MSLISSLTGDTDLIVVVASVVVLSVGSNGQVFATSAIRYRYDQQKHHHPHVWSVEQPVMIIFPWCLLYYIALWTKEALMSLIAEGSVSSRSCECCMWIVRVERGGFWDQWFLFIGRCAWFTPSGLDRNIHLNTLQYNETHWFHQTELISARLAQPTSDFSPNMASWFHFTII